MQDQRIAEVAAGAAKAARLNVDLKRLEDGRWLVCNPRTGHVYYVLPAATPESEVLARASDTERTGWLPRDRGVRR